jgi:hypothetical protein
VSFWVLIIYIGASRAGGVATQLMVNREACVFAMEYINKTSYTLNATCVPGGVR